MPEIRIIKVYPDGTEDPPPYEGLKSGLAILEERLQRGEITEEERTVLAREHILSIYGRAS